MRATPPLSSLILALAAVAGGCAAKKNSASADSYADAYADADYAAADADVSAKRVLDGSSAPAPYGGAMAGVATTSPVAVLGSVAAKPGANPKEGAAAEKAVEDFSTIGADSVDQMLIFTGQLAIELEFATTPTAIDSAVGIAVAHGGYVAEMTDTALRIRVPSKRFRKAMKDIEALGDVRSRGVQALDVSEEFHDLQVRLDNLKATRARIEKLLGQSKDLSEILTIEKELQRVTVEIDQIEGRMRLMASQAAFSTIAMAFSERPDESTVKVIAGGDTPPLSNPRTLASSAAWIGEVGIHGLMNFDATSERTRR